MAILMVVQVAVSAYSGDPPKKLVLEVNSFMDIVEKRKEKLRFFLGGYRGLMKIIVDEMLMRGFKPVLVIPVEYEGDAYPEGCIVVRTGMSFKGRNTVLVRSGDVLVSFGGGSGSIMEIFAAYGEGKHVHLLAGYGLPSDELVKAYPGGSIGAEAPSLIFYYRSGIELAKALEAYIN